MNDFLRSLLEKFQSPGGGPATVTFDDSVRRGIAMHLETMLLEAPRWLDAPTCEGWWWCRSDGEVDSVYFVGIDEGGKFVELNCRRTAVEKMVGQCRWFGPLVPPS